ncbi:hypothetical protein BKA63DRAFT_38141 [Paraphoma chrysanthemicola]|nr:hypothetical protein BKA63DRAFT_38141 [Paraphoma chrysanthemicola]
MSGIAPEESIEAYRRRLDGVACFTYILIMIFVPLKLYCRKKSGGWSNIRLDDYITIIALLIANCFFYVCIIGMRKSLGVHLPTITDMSRIEDFLKNIFIANILYTLSITTIKLSILAFYWRLFGVTASIVIYIVTFMSLAWCIAILLCVIFSCIPVQAAWDVTIVGAKCIPLRSIYLGGSIPNVVLDLVLVIMPLPYVMRLHAPVAQRIVLAGIFALGIFIAVVSLVRLIIFLQIPISTAGDVTYNFREIIVWSIVEVNIGLTCACLPSLKPALAMLKLDRLFSFVATRRSDMQTPDPKNDFSSTGGHLRSTSKSSRPRKLGATGGMFSTLAGTSKQDDDEESLNTINKNVRAKNVTEIELGRVSDDSSRRHENVGLNGGITVQKNWSVFVDDRRDARN